MATCGDIRPEPIVVTAQGPVRGLATRCGLEFRGIPFADAPRGALRFAPPRRAARWADGMVVDARYFGDAAVQPPPVPPWDVMLGTRASSEHCLSLNIWTPAADSQARLPVMVWIHGGGYCDESGSDDPYLGHTFARDGIVLVTINYRLGILGYLHVAESFGLTEGSGNFGSLDQIAALEWVQENIAAFGGDPGNVTIFGESAGAWSVATLTASTRAAGLFRRAICQSGAGEHVLTPGEAQRVTGRCLELLQIEPGDVEALLTVDTQRILRAQAQLYAEAAAGGAETDRLMGDRAGLLLCFLPVTTGDVVSDTPRRLAAAGQGREVDMIVGTNSDEYGLWRVAAPEAGTAERMLALSRHDLASRGVPAAPVERSYCERYGGDDTVLGERMEADRVFRLPALEWVRARTTAGGRGRTYLYELAWAGTDLGACHMMDVPFVFDRLDTPMAAMLAGPQPSQEVASLMHGCWVDFATSGDPDPAGRHGWLPLREGQQAAFAIDDHSRMEEEWEGDLLALWGRG